MIGGVCLQFLSTLNFIHQQYDAIFIVHVHGIELSAAFEGRENIQKKLKFN